MTSQTIWLVVLLGILVTYSLRGLGVFLSSRIDPDGRAFEWVSCVSYAMLAGLIARMTLMPFGELATAPVIDRLVAMAGAFIVFFICGRSVLPGVATGAAILVLASILRAGGL